MPLPPPPLSPSALPEHLSSCSLVDSEGVQRCPELFSRPASCFPKRGQEAGGLSLWPPHNTRQKQPSEALDRLNRKGTGGK